LSSAWCWWDIDVIAAVAPPLKGQITLVPPSELPPAFADAVKRVARDFGLPPDWLNSEVSAQLRTGLPPGFQDRISWDQHGGLLVGLASRRDLIFLKLHAATDQDPASRHTQDLIALRPTDTELQDAAVWVRTQDATEAFSELLNRVVEHVRAHTK